MSKSIKAVEDIEKACKRMMKNVKLSSKTRGSYRDGAQKKVDGVYERAVVVNNNGIVYRAKKQHDINIDWEYLRDLYLKQDGRCHWMPNYKLELDEIFVPHSIKAPSVDRIDNSKGYVKGNVVLTTRFMNLGRGNYGVTEFNDFMKQLFV
tara:strand:+ start:116 stop:565 length:450 start_codon:yes stop_codon:yes gene_type:complete